MARVNFNEIDNFNKTGNSHWLQLKDDGDSAIVQFPFDKADDIEFQNVHNCKTVSKTGATYDVMVSCLREHYDDALDVCPICNSGDSAVVPYLIPVIDYMTGEPKVWKRNKTFMKELEYNIQNTPNFRNTVFKIVRIGKKGDKTTTYKLYPQLQLQPKDFSNVKPLSLVGSVIRQLNYQEMMMYLQTGNLPDKKEQDDPIPFGQPTQPQAVYNQQAPMQAPIQPQAQPIQFNQPTQSQPTVQQYQQPSRMQPQQPQQPQQDNSIPW